MKLHTIIRVFGNIPGEYSNTKNHYSFEPYFYLMAFNLTETSLLDDF